MDPRESWALNSVGQLFPSSYKTSPGRSAKQGLLPLCNRDIGICMQWPLHGYKLQEFRCLRAQGRHHKSLEKCPASPLF